MIAEERSALDIQLKRDSFHVYHDGQAFFLGGPTSVVSDPAVMLHLLLFFWQLLHALVRLPLQLCYLWYQPPRTQ